MARGVTTLKVGKSSKVLVEEGWLVLVCREDGSEEYLEIHCEAGTFLRVMREKGFEPLTLTYERVLLYRRVV